MNVKRRHKERYRPRESDFTRGFTHREKVKHEKIEVGFVFRSMHHFVPDRTRVLGVENKESRETQINSIATIY